MKQQTNKPKLSKGFKTKWVDALRSGRYKEGPLAGSHCFYFEAEFYYTPLGVAYKIAGVNTKTLTEMEMDQEKQFQFVPKELCDHQYGIVQKINELYNNGNSFRWIASYIEKYL
jgi:hypothetical protein